MLSLVDLRDFFEINRSLYHLTANHALAQAQAVDALVRLLASRQGVPVDEMLATAPSSPVASAS